ncbi:MAG: hypothetical protein A2V81_03620 [Candidatus Abawacabacteria bacterium RBG_16_42_10]|uniref:Methyltransferase domain-containing protein n=1 Tax=Candidatus Abawacabacteria bacterium RBG_16_42_10 TaxID=1817814 RepID=A0A1F4XJS4_9BACT|nr:MAG: hypothetical protein A2V81_03620 [Candidatus Abawacabacteria bacterium RBG_16_42_10]
MKNDYYKRNLRSVYNTIADHFSKTRSDLWPELQEFLPYISDKDHVIDIGCGNGRLLKLLTAKSCTYLGIDQSEELLKEATRLWPTYAFELADMSIYHYGRDRFHDAFFIASFHHLASHDEQLKVLKRIHAALKSEGHLFITVWNLWQRKYQKYIQKKPYHHSYIPWQKGGEIYKRFYYAFQKKELVALCKEAGFKILESWYSDGSSRVTAKTGRNICLIAQK